MYLTVIIVFVYYKLYKGYTTAHLSVLSLITVCYIAANQADRGHRLQGDRVWW